MQNENYFNAYITAKIKHMGKSYKVVKTSDRFKLGMPDWLLFHRGNAVAVEAKFVKTRKKKGNVLTHKLSGSQQTALQSFTHAGVPGWVLLGIADEKGMYLIPPQEFVDGQLRWEFFNTAWYWFSFSDVDLMVCHLFYNGGCREYKSVDDEIREPTEG